MDELEGRAVEYPTELYGQLMKKVVPLRQEFRKEMTV